MKSTSRFLVVTATVVAATLMIFSRPLGAQTIPNPSFEADAFAVAPGTINSNTAITGWSVADASKAGLNPAGGVNPYANNGAVPHGANVLVFLPTNVLSTTLSDLTPGSVYNLKFRANSQINNRPTLRVAIDGVALLDAGSVSNVGGLNPYQFVSLIFTSTASAQTLSITNDAAGGNGTNALLLDDFSIALNTSAWSFAAWGDDASSGVDGSKTYTHAYAFNVSGATFPINGVPFTRVAGANPQVPFELQTFGVGSGTTDPGNALKTAAGGSSSNLAHGFVYNGNPEIFNIQNLVPGMEYVATLYSAGWDAVRAYGRAQTWTVGSDRLTVNQDQFGDGMGIRISYRYTAPASGFMSLSNLPLSIIVGSFHTYGLANYEVTPATAPVIGVHPVSKASILGGGAGFYATVGGARPLSYRWLKDGVEIPAQNSRVLALNNLALGDLAQYSLWVSNSFGMVTSATATLTFDTAAIPNPSFEADTYLTYPGYASVNYPVAGWFSSNPAKTGLNPMADVGGPFANNGVVPQGMRTAFLQSTCSLSTTISGVVSGQTYTVQFRANARGGQRPDLQVSVDGQYIFEALMNNVAGTNAYRFISFDFLAANTNALLNVACLTNFFGGDHTVLVDNFSVAPSTSKWSFAIWTNDATAGVDPTKLYTHAFHFGPSPVDTTINGLTFRAVAGGNPSVPGFFFTTGLPSVFTGDVNIFNTTGGGSAGMSSQFVYGGTVQSITLSNLQPGTEYVASIYSVAFDVRGYARAATFNVGNDRMTINQDHFGLDNGIIVSYRYVAGPSGTITLTYTPTDGTPSSFHTYAMANRVASDSAPVIGAQPISTMVAAGDSTTLTVGLSAGSLPTSFQWRAGGVDLMDQTNAILLLSNLTMFGTTGYDVVVSNAFGMVTSMVASVEVGAKISELFNTAVGNDGVLLAGGSVDPHYQLTVSGDTNYPGPDAVVLLDNVYPVVAGTYLTNGPNSSWLAPGTNAAVGHPMGTYVYRTSFVIDTMDPGRSQVSGLWASDNEGLEIRLNGVSLGISNVNPRPFASFASFLFTNGFVFGSNTLEFIITNLPPTGPTGFRAELKGVGRPLAAAAPEIVRQPDSQTVIENSAAVFAVVAKGSGPLSYQWYYEGFPLPDETNRVLRLANVAADQGGNYTVRVSNDVDSTNSMAALLTVLIPPVVLVQPMGQTVECSSNAVFDVTVDGSGPLSYQWHFAGNPISGATAATLVISNAHAAEAGDYFVAVSSPAGSVTSAVATLMIVDTLPPALVCPPNLAVCTSSNSLPVNFVATAVDGCDPGATLVCVPASGFAFPLGTNTVTCTASDSGGRMTNCAFTVTVFKAAAPTAAEVSRSGNNLSFSFQTENGCHYRIEYTDSLAPIDWQPLKSVVGSGGVELVTDTEATGDMRFYRIVVE